MKFRVEARAVYSGYDSFIVEADNEEKAKEVAEGLLNDWEFSHNLDLDPEIDDVYINFVYPATQDDIDYHEEYSI
jgi:hypothetical protein